MLQASIVVFPRATKNWDDRGSVHPVIMGQLSETSWVAIPLHPSIQFCSAAISIEAPRETYFTFSLGQPLRDVETLNAHGALLSIGCNTTCGICH